MPRLTGDIDHHPWHDGHGTPLKGGAPLPFVHKQDFFFVQMFVDRNFRPWQERLDPHRKGASGFTRIDFQDDLAGCGWPELEDLTLARLQNVRDGLWIYFFVSQPSR